MVTLEEDVLYRHYYQPCFFRLCYLPTAVISAQVLVFWDLQMTWPLVCTHTDRNTYISSTIFLSYRHSWRGSHLNNNNSKQSYSSLFLSTRSLTDHFFFYVFDEGQISPSLIFSYFMHLFFIMTENSSVSFVFLFESFHISLLHRLNLSQLLINFNLQY